MKLDTLLVTATLAVGKVLLDCALSFDFEPDLLLLLLLPLSLECVRDFDLELFRFLSLDEECDLLLRD